MMSGGQFGDDELRGRAISVFRYLAELARLRSKNIRDIRSYQQVYWFSDLPREDACYTIAWGESEEHSEDVWLEVKKQKEPVCPQPPSACREWVPPTSLEDSNREPNLFEQLLPQEPESSDSDEAADEPSTPQYLYLEEHPEVSSAWEKYLVARWRPWAELHRKWEGVQQSYSRLFEIHQDIQRLGEQYELVVGLGYLTWKAPSEQGIRRHLLVAQAALNFDAEKGVFTLQPGAEGAKLTLETEMLLPDERPAIQQQRDVEDALSAVAETPWDAEAVVPVLRGWVQALANNADFEDRLDKQETVSEAPRCRLAPALILRKRSGRSLLDVLSKIIKALDSGGDIPPEIGRLVDDPDRFHEQFENDPHPDSENHRSAQPESVYFPLATNQEQLRIVDYLTTRNGVLVQGPPGTGKSHTIANLICHLLATGKRVLVTAETPRALRVLHDKLPKEISPLCVSLLGNDRAALRGLEASVAAISNRYANWNADHNDKEIERLRRQLSAARAQRSRAEASLRSIRERETRSHEVADGAYRGTAQAIARRLAEEKARLGWIPDCLDESSKPPFGPETFREIRRSFTELDSNRRAEFERAFPDPNTIVSADEFLSYVQEERRAKETCERFADARKHGCFCELARALLERVTCLAASIRRVQAAVKGIARRPLGWIPNGIDGILTDQDTPWKSLRDVTVTALRDLRKRAIGVDRTSLKYPEGIACDQLLADATDLKTHLHSGRGFGWWIFRPSVVRRAQYILGSVTVNGRACRTSEALALLVESLEVERTLDYLWSMWKGKAEREAGPLALQVSELEEHLEALDAVLAIEPPLIDAKEACARIDGLGEPEWHTPETLDQLLHCCEAIVAQSELDAVRESLRRLDEWIESVEVQRNAHPICGSLRGAVQRRDAGGYADAYAAVDRLFADRKRISQSEHWSSQLRPLAPSFVSSLESGDGADDWDSRLEHVIEAWQWGRAQSWLQEYLRPGREGELETEIASAARVEQSTMESLVGAMAWHHFFLRMTEKERQHLNAWQLAMKKGGQFRGKYAESRRRDAQEHLDKCRGAVPAWVMPLYRLFETAHPSPQMFDVVIVDEASQCGQDSLVLLYLAKKIVIVGDNQQISPEAVGVNQGAVEQLIMRYLSEIENKDVFDLTGSLFDHGAIRFDNRVVLRELFRCMAEIIRFSNDLCYSSSPLIPLRESPPQRLRPVVTKYVESGEREDAGSRALNRPEAEAVVRAVIACCGDPRYAGKTMGVISLQGDDQARLIESMLLERLEADEISERRIVCGDAYSFQGDERHVIFLSMVAARNRRIGALTKESDKRRFNVAASRAEEQMWLFHSVKLNDLSSRCLRHELLNYCLHPETQRITLEGLDVDELQKLAKSANKGRVKPPDPFDSWFEVDVFLAIVARGFRVIPQYRVAKYRIDLVVEGLSSRLAVECDGDEVHGADRYQEDIGRQRVLERCGWCFWRIRGSEYYSNPADALEFLWEELESRGIAPVSERFQTDTCVDGYVPPIDWSTSETSECELGVHSESRRAKPKGDDSITDSKNNQEVGRVQPISVPSGVHARRQDSQRDEHSLPSAAYAVGDLPQDSDSKPASDETVKHAHDRMVRSLVSAETSDGSSNPPDIPTSVANDIEYASGIEAWVWYELSHWAKENGVFEAKDWIFLSDVGRRLSVETPLTAKQARDAKSLYDQASERGFVPSPVD